MITKSLAFLTMCINGQDAKIFHFTGKKTPELKSYLERLWEKQVTVNEYHIILKQ